MFRRRTRPGLISRARDSVWPRKGWRRAAAYYAHRIKRLPGSPKSIAAGFACGAAVSFTPFVGLHFVFAALLAWIVGGNIIASLIGTAVGNPWTFPFIWVWIYELGIWMLGWDAAQGAADQIAFADVFAQLFVSALRFDFAGFVKYVWPVVWPMFVGGVATSAVIWMAVYWPVRGAVAEYQILRHRRIVKRRAANRKAGGGAVRGTDAPAGTGEES